MRRHAKRWLVWHAVVAGVAAASPAVAQQISRESDIVDLRLGQKVLVDDGACPAGQIKEISGAQLSAAGVVRAARCVPRSGTRK